MPNPENVIGRGRRWKSGQSGNANGRPRKIPALDELLARVLSEEKEGMTAAERIIRALVKKACSGDVRSAEVLLERAYGKIRQQIDHTTKGEQFESLITQIEIIKTVRHEYSPVDNGN